MVKKYSIESSFWSHIVDLGDESPHEEICGALLGDKNNRRVTKYVALTNVSPNKGHHYIPDQNQWLSMLKNTTFITKNAKWDFLGIFHTHPKSEPVASITDINEAGYEGLYWIYSPAMKGSRFYYYDGNDEERQFEVANVVTVD